MTRTLVVQPEAIEEIEEAALWYETRRPGLGLEFMAELERITAHIAEHADAFPVWKEDFPYRQAIAHRFPYLVFFQSEADRVVVMAVAHVRQRPGYWIARLAGGDPTPS